MREMTPWRNWLECTLKDSSNGRGMEYGSLIICDRDLEVSCERNLRFVGWTSYDDKPLGLIKEPLEITDLEVNSEAKRLPLVMFEDTPREGS
ncbi:hypothetical protein Tco_0796238 [Tanacetum coccineum]